MVIYSAVQIWMRLQQQQQKMISSYSGNAVLLFEIKKEEGKQRAVEALGFS